MIDPEVAELITRVQDLEDANALLQDRVLVLERCISRPVEADLDAIAGLLAQGWSRDEMAMRLGCSPRTISRRTAELRKRDKKAAGVPVKRPPGDTWSVAGVLWQLIAGSGGN